MNWKWLHELLHGELSFTEVYRSGMHVRDEWTCRCGQKWVEMVSQ